MKINFLKAGLISAAVIVGFALASFERLVIINESLKTEATIVKACASQPHLQGCEARAQASSSIQYTFDGQRFDDDLSYTVVGANR